jgi:hypothetical protein
MSDLAEAGARVPPLLRDRSGVQRVTRAFEDLGLWVGFYTPGLGRSRTSDWTIEGGHFTAVAVSDRLPGLPRPAGSPRLPGRPPM